MRVNSKQARELGIIPEPPRSPRKRQKVEPDRTAREAMIRSYCEARGLPTPRFEWSFHPERKWRLDIAFIVNCGVGVALEVQGGLFTQGRHTRGAALLDEYQKLNEAQIMGWAVLLVTWQQIDSGEAFALVERALTCTGRYT